jgi:DNA-binding transcriptional LysR family regulator
MVAQRDQGLVIQPSFPVGDDLRSGAPEEVMPGFRSIEMGIYAVNPTRIHVLPKVRLLIDHLVEAFRVKPWSD